MSVSENNTEKTCLYRHWAAGDDLLYVGISLGVLARLSDHERYSHWFRDIVKVTLQWFPDRKTAIDAEKTAITEEKPRFNIHHRPIDTPPSRWMISRDDYMGKLLDGRLVYTIEDAAAILSISCHYLKKLIREKYIASVVLVPPYGNLKRPKLGVTAWQLYAFIQCLEFGKLELPPPTEPQIPLSLAPHVLTALPNGKIDLTEPPLCPTQPTPNPTPMR